MSNLSIKQILNLILGLQVLLFVVTIMLDLEYRWLRYFDATEIRTGPVEPGDQRRLFKPHEIEPDVFPPETKRQVTLPEDMPKRLTFNVEKIPKIGKVIVIYGAIEDGDFNRFVEYYKSLKKPPKLIAFSSPGGSVMEALELGRFIRTQKANTVMLPGMYCFSACPYMFGAGVKRTAFEESALGMHQHYYDESIILPAFLAVEDIQMGQGLTMEYLIEMGIEPELMLYSLNTPPDEIYVLVKKELIDTKLATKFVN